MDRTIKHDEETGEIGMICPRCDRDEGFKFFEAPRDGSWELYRCRFCDFVWRSTEKDHIRIPDYYNPNFKLTDDKLRIMIEKPIIPALRKKPKKDT